jgi:solute carrier family 13 (sodium-dependent dicarboxylate transporter), member 2/3/5
MACMKDARLWALFAGPVLAVLVGMWLHHRGLEIPACEAAAVTTLCAVWWVFEPIPIPATSIIPFALLPALGVLTHKQAAEAYGDRLVLLLLGGSILSTAMEKSGAHRRVALGMVRAVGGRGGRRIVLGFMLASAALSMWISNIATSLMLLPVAVAVLQDADDDRLALPLLLGVAYGASIGGIGTPIGTPPNLLFIRNYKDATGTAMSFLGWMRFGVPVLVVMLPIAWLWLSRSLGGAKRIEAPHPGPWRQPEIRVLTVFAITAVLWMTRTAPSGGWSAFPKQPWWPDWLAWLDFSKAHDSSVALGAVVAMFLIPDGEGHRLLDWQTANRVPWGIMILFGGGLAIAEAFETTGLSKFIGQSLSGLSGLAPVVMLFCVCLAVTFLTELTSNTATTALLMPLLAAAGLGAGIDPIYLMMPAAISASFAFMLPVATPPNAVVFGTGRFTVKQMAREGFVLNLIGAVVVTAVLYIILP